MAAVSYYSHRRQTTVTARTLWLLGFVIIYIDITQDRRATQQQVATTTHVSFSFFWWSAPLCGEMERRTVVVSVIVRSPYLPSVVSSYIHTWTVLQLPNRRILCQRELISRCEGTSQGILMLLSKPTACWPFTPSDVCWQSAHNPPVSGWSRQILCITATQRLRQTEGQGWSEGGCWTGNLVMSNVCV